MSGRFYPIGINTQIENDYVLSPNLGYGSRVDTGPFLLTQDDDRVLFEDHTPTDTSYVLLEDSSTPEN